MSVLQMFLWFFVFICMPESYLYYQKAENVIEQLKMYQVTLFTDSTIFVHKKEKFLFTKIISQNPSVIVSMDNLEDYNQSLEKPVFKSSRKSTVYVILSVARVYNTLNEVARISPIQTRPKCLFILSNKDQNSSTNDVYNVLQYAWSLKFLDFTAVIINNDIEINCVNFNPFTQVFDLKSIESEIFPDKLLDLQQYSLIMPVYDSKPYIVLEEDGKNLHVSGIDIDYINIIAEKMNFRRHYVKVQIENDYKRMNDLLIKLENNEIHLIPTVLLIGSFLYTRNIVIGYVTETMNLVVVVPIIKTSKIYFSLDILLYILSFPVIVSIFVACAKSFKFNPRKWNVLNIFRIFIGVPSSLPRKNIEKIIFILIALLSIIYSNIFFSKFADMKLLYEEENFNSLEDVLNSKMKIYTTHAADKNDPDSVKRIFSKLKKVDRNNECIKILIETRSAICILSDIRAKYYAEENLIHNQNQIMKVTKVSFRYEFLAFPYEKASPFAEKFNKIILLTRESGILKYVRKYRKIKTHDDYIDVSEKTENVLIEELCLILFIGHFLAFIAFLIELKNCYSIQNFF